MLVVADSSPLIVLINIELIQILPQLFKDVVVPPQVLEELGRPNRPRSVREFASSLPNWILPRRPVSSEPMYGLHAGETAAIHLARELGADLLLIDEAAGRRTAARLKIPFAGTVGILEHAADRGLVQLADAFERIKRTDFWISSDLLDARLELHRRRKG